MRNIAQIETTRISGGNETVAANVRAELAYAGERQNALVPVLGVSEMAVSRRLANKTEFTASEIASIANYFGIPAGDLFIERPRPSAPAKPSNLRTLVP